MTNWDEMYRTGEMPWDKGAASPGLVDYLGSHPVSGKILVPGCGLGHDVRALAAAGGEVVGVDIAPAAVARASEYPAVGGEKYEVANLFDLPQSMRGTFDWVWEHTCFCAIDPAQRPAYVEGVAAALRPGGYLLAIFYLDPGNTSPGEGPPFEVSVAELDRLFLPRFTVLEEWLPANAYPGREGREWMRLMQVSA